MITIGEWIHERRKEEGLTIRELALRAQVSAGNLGRWEVDKKQMSVITLAKLEAVLGEAPEEIRKQARLDPRQGKVELGGEEAREKPVAMNDAKLLREWCRIDCRKCPSIEDNACQFGVELIRRGLIQHQVEKMEQEKAAAKAESMARYEANIKKKTEARKKKREEEKAAAAEHVKEPEKKPEAQEPEKERTEEELRTEIRESTREAILKAICLLTQKTKKEVVNAALDAYVETLRQKLKEMDV